MSLTNFKSLITELSHSIRSYMEDCGEDCDFTEKDVQECVKILTGYLSALENMNPPTDKEIMKEVEKAVLAINELNEKTGYSMIETDERERICEILQESALACGLQTDSDDITEDWREF